MSFSACAFFQSMSSGFSFQTCLHVLCSVRFCCLRCGGVLKWQRHSSQFDSSCMDARLINEGARQIDEAVQMVWIICPLPPSEFLQALDLGVVPRQHPGDTLMLQDGYSRICSWPLFGSSLSSPRHCTAHVSGRAFAPILRWTVYFTIAKLKIQRRS